RLADDGILEVRTAHIDAGGAEPAAAAASTEAAEAVPPRLPLAGGHGHDLAGGGVHHPGIHDDGRLRLLLSEAAEAEPVPDHAAERVQFEVLVLEAEFGHAADDDRVDAQDFPDRGGALRVRPAAGAQVLLRKHRV